MYPLLDYRNRDPLSGIGGTPRRTIQIEKDGEIIDMDWDSPTPPTQTDVMRWVNRNKPAPIQVDIQRGMSGMGAKDIDTGLIPKPRPPAPPPAPTGPRFNIERGRTADAARQIDTTVAPPEGEMPQPFVTSPTNVLAATGSGTGRAMGSLLDKPGNLQDALWEGGKGARSAFMGEETTSPSAEFQKRTGVENPAWADFITDAVADIGNVGDPLTAMSHIGMIGATVHGADDLIKALAKKGMQSLEKRAAEKAAEQVAEKTATNIPGVVSRVGEDAIRQGEIIDKSIARRGLGEVPEPKQRTIEDIMRDDPQMTPPAPPAGPPPQMPTKQGTLGFDPIQPVTPHPPEPKQPILPDLIPGINNLPPEIQQAALDAYKTTIAGQPKPSGNIARTLAELAKGNTSVIRDAGKAGPELERMLLKTRVDADRLAGKWSAQAQEAVQGLSKSEVEEYINARDTGTVPNNPKVQEALQKRVELDREIQQHLRSTGAGMDASGKQLPIIEKEGQWPRIYDDKFFKNKDEAIKTMIESGMTPDEAEKVFRSSGRYGQRLIHPDTGQLAIPKYRKDIAADLKHLDDTANRVVEARNFGPQDIADPKSPLSRLIEGTNDPKRIGEIVRRHLGRETPSTSTGHLRSVAQGAIKVQTAMHLSNFAINNLTQQAAIGLRGNLGDYTKALAKTLFQFKKSVGEAAGTGALQTIHQDILREAGGEWWVSKMFGHKRSETFNRTVAALTGKATGESLFQQLKKNPGNKLARARFDNLILEDVDTVLKQDKLTPDQLGRMGGRMSEITQGRAQSIDLPKMWSDHPAASLILLFKKFSFRQTRIIMDAIKENPTRNIPLALGLYTAMGELAGDARAGIKGAASGEGSLEAIKGRGKGIERIASNLAQSWAFGILADALGAATGGKARAMEFLGGPVAGDIARTAGNIGTGNARGAAQQAWGAVPFVGAGLAQNENLLPGKSQKAGGSGRVKKLALPKIQRK